MKRSEFINKWSLSSNERERRIREEFIADLDSLNKHSLLSVEDIEIKFPCEIGQMVVMETNRKYDETRRANYFRRQGAIWVRELAKGNEV